MNEKNNLLGKKFGKWLVIKRAAPSSTKRGVNWLCRCECGSELVRRGTQLRYAEKKGVNQSCQSCGATYGNTKHGFSRTPEYKAWIGLIDRCTNPSNQAYKHYGDRGIGVCERWIKFDNFFEDMGERPSKKHSLDRIDNSMGYSMENCRWATSKTQNRNKRGNHLITFDGQTKSVTEWAEEIGINRHVLYARINTHAWDIKDALSIPAGKACNWLGTEHKDVKKYFFNGESKSLSRWSKDLGINKATIFSRIKRGWTIDRTLSTIYAPNE